MAGGIRAELSDSAAPLAAAGLCRQATASAVACHGPSALGSFKAELGDGNDRLGFVASGNGFTVDDHRRARRR